MGVSRRGGRAGRTCVCWLALLLAQAVPVLAQPSPAPAAERETPPVRRWLDVEQLQVAIRYRWIESTDDVVTSNSLQYQPQMRIRFLVDAASKYAVHAGAFGGTSFVSGWNNMGAGLGSFAGAFHVKQFFFAAQPGAGVQAQVGSLYLLRGENTEITSYDNDGFIVGERVAWNVARGPFATLALTTGYFGDLSQPDAFHRLQRLAQWNYGQALVAWRMSDRLTASADYTYENGRDILREGVTWRLPPATKVLTAVTLDAYERLAPEPRAGFDAAAELRVARSLRVIAGLDIVDRSYGPVNADRQLVGTHAYTLGTYTLTRDLSVGWFHEEAVGNQPALANQHRFEILLTINPTSPLRRRGIL